MSSGKALIKVLIVDLVLQADVVRLFSTRHMQSRLLQALTLLENRLGSYSQGMAFVTAFLLLFLPDTRAIAIVLRLASDDNYLKGYLARLSPRCLIEKSA